jgi:AraC-like DNA-binding protein
MTIHRKATASISLDVARLLLKYAVGLGIDTDAVCRCMGLDIVTLQQDLGGRMAAKTFDALWAEVAGRANDPWLGLHFGEAIPGFSSGHILMGMMLNCSTLEEALARFCRYHGLLSDGAVPELRVEGDDVVFHLQPVPTEQTYYPEAVLAMLTVIVQRLTESQVQPIEVRLTHSQPADLTEHRRIFNARLLFAQPCAGMVFKREALRTAIFLANPILLDALERVARSMVSQPPSPTTWTVRTGGIMAQLLLRGEAPRLPIVARELAMSPRHLQNKLRAEGTSFQALLDTERKRIALNCLSQTEMTLCEIAFLLGFSEQSAFNHAFRRWTGGAPGDFKITAGNSHGDEGHRQA